MSSSVNGTDDGAASEKVAILDAGAQYGKVCSVFIARLLLATPVVK